MLEKKNILISVIVATCNRCETLKDALQTLCHQETEGTFEYEVIVADNNSNDRTKDVAESFIKQEGSKFRYIFEPTQGKSYALNKAIGVAHGEIVAFTDDDVTADPQWLLNIKKCFQESHCDGLGGRILPKYPENAPQWIKDNIDILMGTIVSYDYGPENKKYGKPLYEFLGANYAFHRKMFEQYGLLRTDLGVGKSCLGEDTEYVNRLEKKNRKLFYCGQALVWHPVDLKRSRLSFIAKWNIALGRYRMRVSEYESMPKDLASIQGVPRYLVREMLQNLGLLAVHALNRRKFLKTWIQVSIDYGRSLEFKELSMGLKK